MLWVAIITAIATSITGVVAVMLYLLNKPRVKIISAVPIHWWYIYRDGLPHNGNITGARMTIKLQIINDGGTYSYCQVTFTANGQVIFTGQTFEIAGHGGLFDGIISLEWTRDNKEPPKPQLLEGILKIEPWGNRTFLIGRKVLETEMVIPYDIRGN